jgi:tetratricopeptide (TPR) repeat protein
VETGSGVLAFHPQSRIAAIQESNASTVRLVDVETGRALASLDAADQSVTTSLVFSPDGRFLAAAKSDIRVDVWDLSTIRRRLEELNLAFGFPDSFEATTAAADAPTVESILLEGADPAAIRILTVRQTLRRAWFALRALFDADLADANELRTWGRRWQRLGHWRLAAQNYRAALAQRPDWASAANDLARCLAAVPGRGDPAEALRWARQAVALDPDNTSIRNTLGLALYRAGRFAEAAVELDRDIAQGSRLAGCDWVFLAMCRQRLGQPVSARTALEQATRWLAQASGLSAQETAEIGAFLREAESILDGSPPDLPADVLAR